METHRGQNSRVEPGIPVPVDNFTRPDPTRDNDDPTRPDPRVTGRVGYTRGYGYTRKPLEVTNGHSEADVGEEMKSIRGGMREEGEG